MIKVFLDSSVLVAASASKTGASAFVLGYCHKKKVLGYTSLDALGEAKKNITLKLEPFSQNRFAFFLQHANILLVENPSVEEIAKCEKVINVKDAPILAAAINSPASFLLTLDRKHFLKPEVMAFTKSLKVSTPGEFVSNYLRPQEG